MKNIINMKQFTICLLFGTMLIGVDVFGQYDPESKTILDAMSAKYKAIPSFTADISYTLENVEDDIHESFEGQIGIKGDKFRLVAVEQEIIINDGNVWTYLAEENEVNIDTYDPEEDDITPSNIYNVYQSGYKYNLFGQEMIDGKQYNVVDLSPEDKESDYFRIRLVIGTDNILRKFTLFAKSANRYIYELSNFDPSVNLQDSYFIFDVTKYEDIEIIDLRIDY